MPDNSTAIAYINKQGGTKSTSCNQLIKDTWTICMEKNHVSAAHVPGKQNILADTASIKSHHASKKHFKSFNSMFWDA